MSTPRKDELNISFTMDDLEDIIQRDLKYSQESAINDDLSVFDTKLNTLALVVTKMFKEVTLLRSNNDALLRRLVDYEFAGDRKFDKLNNRVNEVLVNESKSTEKQICIEKLLDLQYNVICNIQEKITKLEKTSDINDRALLDLQQYVRRPSIEIEGVSDRITDKDLESFVINQILKRTVGYKISHDDIEACHRYKKRDRSQPDSVIVRFVKLAKYSKD